MEFRFITYPNTCTHLRLILNNYLSTHLVPTFPNITHPHSQGHTSTFTRSHIHIHKVTHPHSQGHTSTLTRSHIHTHKVTHPDSQGHTSRLTRSHIQTHKVTHPDSQGHTSRLTTSHTYTSRVSKLSTHSTLQVHTSVNRLIPTRERLKGLLHTMEHIQPYATSDFAPI